MLLIGAIVAFVCAVVTIFVLAVSIGPHAVGRHRRLANTVGTPVARLRVTLPLLSVAPVSLMNLSPDDARAFNAGIPNSTAPNPPAMPLTYVGTPADHEAALTCLASAVLYEAGEDRLGQQAVAQVVLNRLRHPAFPKTICGVVFQGSERKTGCQFTFTCDGSLARVLSGEAWARASDVADKAMTGYVFKPVGLATHYHTDWVVPYWYASLDKITSIHTQIFYRWKSGWGRPAAFSKAYQSPEIPDPMIASHLNQTNIPVAERAALVAAASEAPLPVVKIAGLSDDILKGSIIRLADPSANSFVLQLDPSAYPGSYAVIAFGICKGKPHCLVMGWTKAAQLPANIPVSSAHTPPPAFVFRYDGLTGEGHPAWDCKVMARDDPSQCLP